MERKSSKEDSNVEYLLKFNDKLLLPSMDYNSKLKILQAVDKINLSLNELVRSGIGKSVKKLVSSEGELGRLASTLVQRWRAKVDELQNDSSVHEGGKRKYSVSTIQSTDHIRKSENHILPKRLKKTDITPTVGRNENDVSNSSVVNHVKAESSKKKESNKRDTKEKSSDSCDKLKTSNMVAPSTKEKADDKEGRTRVKAESSMKKESNKRDTKEKSSDSGDKLKTSNKVAPSTKEKADDKEGRTHVKGESSMKKESNKKDTKEKSSDSCDKLKTSNKGAPSTKEKADDKEGRTHDSLKRKGAINDVLPKETKKVKHAKVDDTFDGSSGLSFEECLLGGTSSRKVKKSKKRQAPNSQLPWNINAPQLEKLPEILPSDLIVENRFISEPQKPVQTPVYIEIDTVRESTVPMLYAGKRKSRRNDTEVVSLQTLCQRVLQEVQNPRRLEQIFIATLNTDNQIIRDVGGYPYILVEPVVKTLNPTQLGRLERINPVFQNDSDVDQLWKNHVEKKFRGKCPLEGETWRSTFIRLTKEEKNKFEAVKAKVAANVKKEELAVTTQVPVLIAPTAMRRRFNGAHPVQTLGRSGHTNRNNFYGPSAPAKKKQGPMMKKLLAQVKKGCR